MTRTNYAWISTPSLSDDVKLWTVKLNPKHKAVATVQVCQCQSVDLNILKLIHIHPLLVTWQ